MKAGRGGHFHYPSSATTRRISPRSNYVNLETRALHGNRFGGIRLTLRDDDAFDEADRREQKFLAKIVLELCNIAHGD